MNHQRYKIEISMFEKKWFSLAEYQQLVRTRAESLTQSGWGRTVAEEVYPNFVSAVKGMVIGGIMVKCLT